MEASRCSQLTFGSTARVVPPFFQGPLTVLCFTQNIRRWLGRLIRVQKLEASEPLPCVAKVQMCTSLSRARELVQKNSVLRRSGPQTRLAFRCLAVRLSLAPHPAHPRRSCELIFERTCA